MLRYFSAIVLVASFGLVPFSLFSQNKTHLTMNDLNPQDGTAVATFGGFACKRDQNACLAGRQRVQKGLKTFLLVIGDLFEFERAQTFHVHMRRRFGRASAFDEIKIIFNDTTERRIFLFLAVLYPFARRKTGIHALGET